MKLGVLTRLVGEGVDPSAGRMELPVIVSLEKPGRLSGGNDEDNCFRGDLRKTAGVTTVGAPLPATSRREEGVAGVGGEEGGWEPNFSHGADWLSCCC